MSSRHLWAVIAILVGLATTARADDRDDAKREFAAGQAADKAKDWQAALEHYLSAYEHLPHPFALYNIGNDYEQLGNLREAAHFYQRYLEAAPDSADRERVSRALADLKLRPSRLVVRSTPPGALVTLDNNPVGPTPYSGTIRGGRHHVGVRKDNQHDDRDFTAEFGEPVDLTLKLGDATGTIVVRSVPFGALVTVDELAAGVTPVSVPVAPGPHQVKITQSGFAPFEQTAAVGIGSVTVVDTQLVRDDGTSGGTGAQTIHIGYLAGVDAGVDVRSATAVVEFELGLRWSSYEAIFGFGKAAGSTAIDVDVRWNLLKARLTPFIGAGYSYIDDGGGYQATAGLRYDLSTNDTYAFSILATAGVRYFSGTTLASDGITTVSTTGFLVPVMVSLVATKFR